MSSKIGYLFADSDLTVILRGRPYEVPKSHLRFKEIANLLALSSDAETEEEEEARCAALEALVVLGTEEEVLKQSLIGYEDITLVDGCVYVKGEALHTALTQRILDLAHAGLPYSPFIKFMANLSQNPSSESRESLFSFLEQGKFPLTDDGCFLGYKGVSEGRLTGEDGKVYSTLVDHHSKTFDMSPGNTHSMPWNEVDNNRNEACGQGFHVGTLGHARNFGSRMVVVKVNPKDCVSVPTCDTTKLRCCAYTVVNEFLDASTAKEFSRSVYSEEDYKDNEWESADRKFAEENVVETGVSREEELSSLGRDDLCRAAASQGYFWSTNEARWAGKAFVLSTMVNKAFPLATTGMDMLKALAVKRRVLSCSEASTVGRDKLSSLLAADLRKSLLGS